MPLNVTQCYSKLPELPLGNVRDNKTSSRRSGNSFYFLRLYAYVKMDLVLVFVPSHVIGQKLEEMKKVHCLLA